MNHASRALGRAILLARMATAVFFLFFGEYKVFDPGFAHGGFQNYLHGYIAGNAVALYRPVLANVILLHAVFFGYVVGVVELCVALSLLFGIWVRIGSILGMLHMTSLALATWWEPGHGVPTWRYFGAQLDHLPLLLLFFFYAADAGRPWGVDGWLEGKRLRASRDKQASPSELVAPGPTVCSTRTESLAGLFDTESPLLVDETIRPERRRGTTMPTSS